MQYPLDKSYLEVYNDLEVGHNRPKAVIMDLKLYEYDYKFMSIIWDNEPVASGQLVKLCSKKLGWKKSTTYSTLKKLCERGFAQNKDTVVTSLVARGEVQAYASEQFVENTFYQ